MFCSKDDTHGIGHLKMMDNVIAFLNLALSSNFDKGRYAWYRPSERDEQHH
jgi:hypothetical protein